MKNFRKVLALVLVVATLFSFVAMTASAKEYTDTDKVSYTEAVDVLSAIGILNGYPDGTFRPTNTISRAEMAKMVAVLSNAGDDISDMYAAACKFADMNGDAVWAKSYVAYCNQTGIVAGRNATTFDPNGKVTGIETAKMLLCVLGFDAKVQGYVGTNWKTNILRDAKNFGLLDGFAADYEADRAITREEAAQMMLNALKANIVIGTISDNLVTITNTLYRDELGNWQITIPDAEKEGWIVLTRHNVVISNTMLASIYDGLTVERSMDCYGNPGIRWIYRNAKGTEVFNKFYVDAADYSYTNAASLVTDLDEELDNDYWFVTYVDGERTNNSFMSAAALRTFANNHTGKGVETHVYVDDVFDFVVITVKNTYIGHVRTVSNMETKFVLEDAAYGTSTAFDNTDYGFKTGDVVLYWICSSDADFWLDRDGVVIGTVDSDTNQLHDAKLANVVTGALTDVSYDKSDSDNYVDADVTLGGKTYEYAANFGVEYTVPANGEVMDDDQIDRAKNDGVSFDLYLDEFGYIMGWRETPDNTVYEYGYFIENTNWGDEAGMNPGGTTTYKYTATYIDFEGQKHDVAINKATFDKMTEYADEYNARANDAGMLASFVVGSNDVVGIADDPATKSWPDERVGTYSGTDAYLAKDGSIKSDNDADGAADSTWISATAQTKYLVRTWDYEKEEYVYTGYTKSTLPSDLFVAVPEGGAATYKMQYFWEEIGVGTYTARALTHVFIDATYSRTATRAFVLDYIKTYSSGKFYNQIGTYDAYNAVINGQMAILALTQDISDVAGTGSVDRDEIFYLIKANLEVIGLDANGVPVYALTNNITPTLERGNFLFYYKDTLFYSDRDGEIDFSHAVTVTPAEGCKLVIGKKTVNSDGTLSKKSVVIEDSIADLASYLREATGTPVEDVYYYVLDQAWIVKDANGDAIEVYLNLDGVKGVGVNGDVQE